MCTDGRIRLFWGVSPDVMSLALKINHTVYRLVYFRSVRHYVNKQDDTVISFGTPKYIYIYI